MTIEKAKELEEKVIGALERALESGEHDAAIVYRGLIDWLDAWIKVWGTPKAVSTVPAQAGSTGTVDTPAVSNTSTTEGQ